MGENEGSRMEFVQSVVSDHIGCPMYRTAKTAEKYYAKHNVTIERFQKFLYSANGNAYPALFSASYRLKTLFFRRFFIQQVQ